MSFKTNNNNNNNNNNLTNGFGAVRSICDKAVYASDGYVEATQRRLDKLTELVGAMLDHMPPDAAVAVLNAVDYGWSKA